MTHIDGGDRVSGLLLSAYCVCLLNGRLWNRHRKELKQATTKEIDYNILKGN